MASEPCLAVHATVVAIGGRGLLIRGPSRSGKSSLAVALIASSQAVLVGDDRVLLARFGRDVIAAPHPRIAGLIERRGHGIVAMPFRIKAPISAIVELGAGLAAAASYPAVMGKNFPSLFLVNESRWDARCGRVLDWFTATSVAH